MSDANKLSMVDVTRLIKSGSEARVDIARKISKRYAEEFSDFSPQEIELSEEIIRLLLQNTEEMVRGEISNNLKDSTQVPKDIIMSLASDTEEVSSPILRFSKVLSDEDLISIVQTTRDTFRQVTIAERENVSEPVSSALIDTKKEEVVVSLLENETSQVSQEKLADIAENYPESVAIASTLIERENMPAELTEKLVGKISDIMKASLKNRFNIDSTQLDKLMEQNQEITTLNIMGVRLIPEIVQLVKNGKITPFSALCIGNLDLFEISIARLAKVPIANVRKILRLGTDSGIKQLYDKTALPESMFEAMLAVLSILNQQRDEARTSPDRMRTNWILEKISLLEKEQEIPNLRYFVTIIRHLESFNRESHA